MNPFQRVSVANSRAEMAALWEEIGPFADDVLAAANARLAEIERGEAPRCRMCAQSARWLDARGIWAPYCSGQHCGNRDRLCQQCGRPFRVGVDGAGTKYCGVECKGVGYRPAAGASKLVTCAECGTERRGKRQDRLWPYVCDDCRHPLRYVIGSLKRHRVPWEMARTLRENPGCQVCGVGILRPTHATNGGGARSTLVVDHDHGCCPGDQSCGKCVRGFLCSPCNSGVGMFGDDPDRMRAAADYIEKYRHGA